jgi:hypothetical protein
MPDCRRWVLFLNAQRPSNLGIAYDIVDPNEDNNWILMKSLEYSTVFHQSRMTRVAVCISKQRTYFKA